MTRIRLEGTAVGRWAVLRYVGGSRYECRCACGAWKLITGQQLRLRETLGCRACLRARVTVPEHKRVCRWCRRSTRAVGGTARECGACARRAARNGRDAIGAPVWRSR